MLKIKDVVKINGKYETVSFINYIGNHFEIIGEDKWFIFSEIDKDADGNPIILPYGELVEQINKDDPFYFYGVIINEETRYPMFLVCDIKAKNDVFLIVVDNVRPIQKKKLNKQLNKQLGDLEANLQLTNNCINNLLIKLQEIEGK